MNCWYCGWDWVEDGECLACATHKHGLDLLHNPASARRAGKTRPTRDIIEFALTGYYTMRTRNGKTSGRAGDE